MPVKFLCSSCNKTLRVSEKYVGKRAKCPQCTTVNTVPAQSASEQLDSSAGIESLPSVDTSFGNGAQPQAAPVGNNPYAVSTAAKQSAFQSSSQMKLGAGNSGGVLAIYRPLHEASFFLGLLAWGSIILGGIFCLTIVGAIQGGIMLWVGITLKGANDSIKHAFQTGNTQALYIASSKLSTYFKINGVLMMIGVGILLLYVLFIIVFMVIAVSANAAKF